ncbi:hypothetical protein GCM10010278_10030 [Streptomyces melanogenes]|nr:hypothetical protein GCM10010278_10030 [Streptomyces melanogenes]
MTWALPPFVPAVTGSPLRDDPEPTPHPECAICQTSADARTHAHDAEGYSVPPNPSNAPPSNR